jgi:hypothetical protein
MKYGSAVKPTKLDILLFFIIVTEFQNSYLEMCNNSFTAAGRVQSQVRTYGI